MSKQIDNWTVTDITDRFEEAAQTLKRLPPVRCQRHAIALPD
jgi:hypothetical protein